MLSILVSIADGTRSLPITTSRYYNKLLQSADSRAIDIAISFTLHWPFVSFDSDVITKCIIL